MSRLKTFSGGCGLKTGFATLEGKRDADSVYRWVELLSRPYVASGRQYASVPFSVKGVIDACEDREEVASNTGLLRST
jgi:hypothetical protein